MVQIPDQWHRPHKVAQIDHAQVSRLWLPGLIVEGREMESFPLSPPSTLVTIGYKLDVTMDVKNVL